VFEGLAHLHRHFFEEALRHLALLVRHQLEHGVEVRIAPLFETLDFLLVAASAKSSIGVPELEAVLDGELLVDGFHHRQDFG
jgi:hypothetical protein